MKMIIAMMMMMVAYTSAQDSYTQINIIQFSDEYCLCPNQQKISFIGQCLPVLGGYETYRLVDGTPDQVVVQQCTDKACTSCVNTTSYPTLPPCQAGADGVTWNTVLPEDDTQTYYNAPSVMTLRFNSSSCSGDPVHIDIEYGLSCFPLASGGSYYYECAQGVTDAYYAFNCSDNACLVDCEGIAVPTETCSNDEGVYKSVQCTPSSSSTATSQTSQTSVTSGQNTVANAASATVSTTTSASSHNVSSSTSAGNTAATASSATSGTSGGSSVFTNDIRGGYMRPNNINKKSSAPRSNPPFCNGGIPSTASTGQTSVTSGQTSVSSGQTSFTAGTSGTATSGGSSGGNGRSRSSSKMSIIH